MLINLARCNRLRRPLCDDDDRLEYTRLLLSPKPVAGDSDASVGMCRSTRTCNGPAFLALHLPRPPDLHALAQTRRRWEQPPTGARLGRTWGIHGAAGERRRAR